MGLIFSLQCHAIQHMFTKNTHATTTENDEQGTFLVSDTTKTTHPGGPITTPPDILEYYDMERASGDGD